MKKFLSVCLILILFSSCNAKAESNNLKEIAAYPFTCAAKIVYGDFSASADLCFKNTVSATLEFTAPQTVEGLIFSFDGETASASFNGLTFSVNNGAGSVAELLFKSITAAKTFSAKATGSKNEISSKVNGADFKLTFDKNSGDLLKLTVPSKDFEVNFSDFKILT